MKQKISIFLCIALLFASLTGCGGKNDQPTNAKSYVNVYNWGEYIDEQVLREFEQETGIHVNYMTFETNEQLYSILRQGGSSHDVIIPSDYMISRLIAEDMLEKINLDNVPNASLLDSSFASMDFDPTGEYSVPYMWGTVGIIYNTTMIADPVTSWSALFDAAYADKILMFDNSRDAMGIALKYLGYSLNTTDTQELDEAFALLQEQKPLLQAYVMDQIFDKLVSGEAAIGPYYAGDYLTMVADNPDLAFVVPEEGSNRFVDSMCIPKGAPNKENAEAFINFMCKAEVSQKNAEYIGYTSPIAAVKDTMELDEKDLEVMYPSETVLGRCEFFVNLPRETLEAYDNYWSRLKS